jgi:hypothetical protein
VIDTTQAATDTIQYVATLPAQAGDQSGLTSTSTRTVIIEPVTVPPTLSPSASSTEASSTSQ